MKAELLLYYQEQFAKHTQDDYKRHYRQMITLIENGKTFADKKAITLNQQMLDNLWFFYQSTKYHLNPAEMGRKGGAKSKGGGRPPKADADPKRRERYLKSKEKKENDNSTE